MIITAYIGLILTSIILIFGALLTAHDDGVGKAISCLVVWSIAFWSIWVVAQSYVHCGG